MAGHAWPHRREALRLPRQVRIVRADEWPGRALRRDQDAARSRCGIALNGNPANPLSAAVVAASGFWWVLSRPSGEVGDRSDATTQGSIPINGQTTPAR